MAFEIKMPQLGLTMEEGTVAKWLKQEGDSVKKGDVLLEITTDKLTSEIESEADGVLLKIVAEEGEDVPVRVCWVISVRLANRLHRLLHLLRLQHPHLHLLPLLRKQRRQEILPLLW